MTSVVRRHVLEELNLGLLRCDRICMGDVMKVYGLVLLLAGCSSPPVVGTVVDGLSGQPLSDFRLVARAVGDASATCAVVETTSDSTGQFTFDGMCTGSSDYAIVSSNESWWFPEGAVVPKGSSDALALAAWQAPGGSGLFKLAGKRMERLTTAGDIKKDTVFGTDETFWYPSEIPSSPPRVAAGEVLVLVGKDYVTEARIYPLNDGPEAIKVTSSDSRYALLRNVATIGLAFTGETDYAAVGPITVDADKQVEKVGADRAARYIQSDAVPPGRYAIFKENDRRLYLVDFGLASASNKGDESQ